MKPPKTQEIYAPKDVTIPARLGGGVLKERVIRELPSKKVISYALAYINPLISAVITVGCWVMTTAMGTRTVTTWVPSVQSHLPVMKLFTTSLKLSGRR